MSPHALLIHGPARLVTTQPNVSRHGLWKFRRAKLLSPPLVYIFVLHEINCIINYESLTNALKQLFHFWIFRIVVVPTQTSAAPHDLPNRTILMSMRTISCMRHICNFLLPEPCTAAILLFHPFLQRAPTDKTVGLRNPVTRRHIRVGGVDQVFGSACT
jgi:hypothetical protein